MTLDDIAQGRYVVVEDHGHGGAPRFVAAFLSPTDAAWLCTLANGGGRGTFRVINPPAPRIIQVLPTHDDVPEVHPMHANTTTLARIARSLHEQQLTRTYDEALTLATAYASQLGIDIGTQEGGQAPGVEVDASTERHIIAAAIEDTRLQTALIEEHTVHATDITATITRPDIQDDWFWPSVATTAWLNAARAAGITITAKDFTDHGDSVAARVRVDDTWFDLEVGRNGNPDQVRAIEVTEQ